EDPSGARLVLSVRDGDVSDLLPSFAGTPGARLADIHLVNDEVSVANVLDENGNMLTMIGVEVEQRRLLPEATGPVVASVVGLGVEMTVHADAEAFESSDASLLGSPDDDPGDPQPHMVEPDSQGPLRMAAELLISYGVFGDPEQASAYA